jgi:FkbM family methyltransferase
MKQWLLAHPIGQVVLQGRDWLRLHRALHTLPLEVGASINDNLATRIIAGVCQPGRTFVDVGAHIGSIIAAVHQRVPSARIIAIEADPSKLPGLRHRFPFVELHGCAVGEDEREITFHVYPKASGYNSISDRVPKDGGMQSVEIKVPMKKLDDLIKPSEQVDTIKIDVEGAELGVLRGSVGTIERCRPVIMFESGPFGNFGLGYSREGLHEFFGSRKYVVMLPSRVAENYEGMSLAVFLDSHEYPALTRNYLAIPVERRDEIRTRVKRLLAS